MTLRTWRIHALLLIWTMSHVIFIGILHAAGSPSENQLKVAYLYNFTKFVKWPEHAFANQQVPFHLCVLGQDPFGPLLDILSKKKVRGRALFVKRLSEPQTTTTCHLLFISSSKSSRLAGIFNTIQHKPILTVGDRPNFANQGGMVNFVREGDSLRFEINRQAAQQAKLKISSKMLQIGNVIHP